MTTKGGGRKKCGGRIKCVKKIKKYLLVIDTDFVHLLKLNKNRRRTQIFLVWHAQPTYLYIYIYI